MRKYARKLIEKRVTQARYMNILLEEGIDWFRNGVSFRIKNHYPRLSEFEKNIKDKKYSRKNLGF